MGHDTTITLALIAVVLMILGSLSTAGDLYLIYRNTKRKFSSLEISSFKVLVVFVSYVSATCSIAATLYMNEVPEYSAYSLSSFVLSVFFANVVSVAGVFALRVAFSKRSI